MFKVLFRFWLRRFIFTFSVALVALFCWNYNRYGLSQNMLINTWVWALLAAIVSSSLSTYWAYTRQCKVLKTHYEKRFDQKSE
ncbi:hypothetical protein GCM10011613_29550 [Cellvibrio zantedeschiae]|uniref:Uncharacterized protein n=1 Tax=Cellvibrio zantedeschiae TaxID=1237077 RepID=A0ABQ3B851_9GAMM|nr:hypothetical protein [Cellvibrio zantedeschiae]GGY82797.1 hypothetical protein GCM10011613_29550 [Cellvibrio zantedeschiae]